MNNKIFHIICIIISTVLICIIPVLSKVKRAKNIPVTAKWDSEEKRWCIKNGQGTFLCWHPNGVMALKIHMKKNKPDGKIESW